VPEVQRVENIVEKKVPQVEYVEDISELGDSIAFTVVSLLSSSKAFWAASLPETFLNHIQCPCRIDRYHHAIQSAPSVFSALASTDTRLPDIPSSSKHSESQQHYSAPGACSSWCGGGLPHPGDRDAYHLHLTPFTLQHLHLAPFTLQYCR